MRFRLALSTLAVGTLTTLALILSTASHAQAQPGGGSGGGGLQPFTCDPWCGGDSTVWPWIYLELPR
jgi:hypothetical protein